MSHHLSIPLINPWAATPSPSSTGTSLLLSTFWGQRKISDSGPKHWWKIFWAAVIAKGQDEKIRIQHILERKGKKNTPAYAHIEVFSGLAWLSATQSCLISPGELICPQAAQNWGGRKWPFTHSLSFLTHPFQTMFLCSVSCWFPSMLPMRWEPSVPLRPADKAQYKKAVLQGTHLCFITPPCLPPFSLPLPSSDESYTEFSQPETARPSGQRPCFLTFVKWCYFSYISALCCSSISLTTQSFTPSLT